MGRLCRYLILGTIALAVIWIALPVVGVRIRWPWSAVGVLFMIGFVIANGLAWGHVYDRWLGRRS